jgi:two-component system response regulator PilR (NtrC family)
MARVLLVEGLEDLCIALSKLISRGGFEVRCATNVADAKAAAAQENYELAIVDAQLGDDSGLELVQTLAQQFPKMQFLVMSGYSPGNLHMKPNRRVNFMAKPFAPRRLIDRIRDILDERVA